MEALLIIASLAVLVALAGVIYPFRPFGKRRNALLTGLVCFVFVGVAAPKGEGQKATSGERFTVDEKPQTTNQITTIAKPQKVEEPASQNVQTEISSENESLARRRELEGKFFKAVNTLQWNTANFQLRQLKSQGLLNEEFIADAETNVLELVRPLPASERETNLAGYEILTALRPEKPEYSDKVVTYQKAISAERNRLVQLLNTSEDRVEGITWYKHPNQPKYLNSRSTAYLYIGKKGGAGRPWLRLKVQYTNSTWLFVRRVTAWHDGIKEPFVSGGFERDNNSTIWEWVDVTPDAYQTEVLRSLANAKEAILRFEGDQYRRDVTLSTSDKRAIREVLAAYEIMKSGI